MYIQASYCVEYCHFFLGQTVMEFHRFLLAVTAGRFTCYGQTGSLEPIITIIRSLNSVYGVRRPLW